VLDAVCERTNEMSGSLIVVTSTDSDPSA